MPKKQSRLSGALALTIAQAVVLVLGYITHPLIGRFLGQAAYGVYGVVLSMQSILGLLLTLGVPIAVSRFVARDEEHARSTLKQALRIQSLVALLVAAATFTLSSFLASVLGDASLANYIRLTAVIIFLQAYYPVFLQFLSGLQRFNRQATLMSFYAVAKLVGALGLLFVFGLYGALAGFAVGGVLAGILGWWWTWRIGGVAHKVLPLRSFLQFSGTYVLTLVGIQILISLDLFMVKALLHDDDQAGYYNAAVTLSRISYMLLQALAFILLPSVSALTKPGASHDSAAAFIAAAIRYLIMLIVPSVAIAAATTQPLVILFFSRDYLAAAPILSILMVGLGCLAFYLLLVNIVAGAGKAVVGLGVTVGLLVVSALLGLFLIPHHGLIGAAWQTTITGIVGLAVLAVYTFRQFRIPVPIKSIINVLVAAAIAVAPTYLWNASPLTLPIQYLLGGALYLGTLWLLREITAQDRQRLAAMHPKLDFMKPNE